MSGRPVSAALIACCLTACGGNHHQRPPVRVQRGGAHAQLTGAHPCQFGAHFTCAWLTVPLDHAGMAGGTLRLQVGIEDVSRAPRGVLLMLTGGPGQPGVSLIPRVVGRLGAMFQGFRLVMFDQRGTGATALRCPALQADAGSSDLMIVPRSAVVSCANEIGPARRYFSTPETVADIESLRTALGAERLTLDGVSYGTFVAERYALTYPRRVFRLVLDSVVPQLGVDPLYLAALQATARVLRDACAAQRCSWDPAQDLRAVVQRQHNGPLLLNALVAESVEVPSFVEVLRPLHAAAGGRPQALNQFLAAEPSYESATADQLSQGLHESTLCLDLIASWNPQASATERALTLQRAIDRVSPQSLLPFDQTTAVGNGIAQGCLDWPPTAPPAVYDGNPSASLPPVPVLLLTGARDLSTPLAWAREELAKAPDGRLVIVPGAGHSVQTRTQSAAVRRVVTKFLEAQG